MSESIPDGLTELEYSRHLLEYVLGWPAKGNIELLADCVRSISLAKKLTKKKAYLYLVRAVKLAKQQGIAVDHFFFANGVYTEVKPEKSKVPWFHGPTKEEVAAFEAHKQTDEYKQAQAQWEAAWRKLAGDPKFQTKREKAEQ